MWSSYLHCLTRTNILRYTSYPWINIQRNYLLIQSQIFSFFLFVYGNTKVLCFLLFTENKETEHTYVLPGNVTALQRRHSFQVQSWVCFSAPGILPVVLFWGLSLFTFVVIVYQIRLHLLKWLRSLLLLRVLTEQELTCVGDPKYISSSLLTSLSVWLNPGLFLV